MTVFINYYSLETGIFTGRRSINPSFGMPVVVPEGCGAFVADSVAGMRVDVQTGTLVEHEVVVPTDAELEAARAAVRVELIAALDGLDNRLRRPLGEALQALALGQAVPEASLARVQAINASKDELRALLADVAAAQPASAVESLRVQIQSLLEISL